MKKEYLRRRNASVYFFWGRGVRPLTVGVVAVVAILLAIRLIAPGFFITIAAPFWRAGAYVSDATGGFFAIFHDRASLERERDAALVDARAEAEQNALLSAKVNDLQRLLGNRTEPAPGIVAGVLARPPESPYDAIVVDAGTDEGVIVGAAVSGPGGTPVGTVASVTKSAARITLYSAPTRSTAAWIGDSRLPTTLIGLGAGAFYAEAPADASTTPGESIYVAGPGAIPIASIERIDRDPSSPTAIVRVTPFVNPFSLTWVTISRTAP